MQIAFFGSSLVSAYWNGAATYYRGLIRALAARGHHTTFYEPNAYGRQEHRDIDDPPWATVVVYPATPDGVAAAWDGARGADLVVKASGVGIFDEWLDAAIPDLQTGSNVVAYWDVDAPATLERVRRNETDPFREQIPRYDVIFTYGGGDPVVSAYTALGAKQCVPIYNALDPDTHHPESPNPRFAGELGFLGNRLPDRERRVEEFFLVPAARLPEMRFLLGGAGWGDKPRTANVSYLDHVYTRDHNAFNSTPRAILNISRDSMAGCGFSPATRVFEAAGAGACIVTDQWKGIECFLEPEREVLVAASGAEVVELLRALTEERAQAIGAAARRHVLAAHTYTHRAALVEFVLDGRMAGEACR